MRLLQFYAGLLSLAVLHDVWAQTLVAVAPEQSNGPVVLIVGILAAIGGILYLKAKRPDLYARLTRVADRAKADASKVVAEARSLVESHKEPEQPQPEPQVAPEPAVKDGRLLG